MKLNRAQLLALNLDSHIVVNAGAGTGKTSTIIDRVLEHYLSENQRATRILPKPERPIELSGGMIVSEVVRMKLYILFLMEKTHWFYFRQAGANRYVIRCLPQF